MPAVQTVEVKHIPEEQPAIEAFLCRITNPSPRARVIYDGIFNDKPIHIPPGKSVDVVLSDLMIGKLQDAELINPEDPDLKVVEIGPPPPPPAPPQARARRSRPVHARQP